MPIIDLDPADEITGSEDLINLPEVRARIAVLKPFHVEDTRMPESVTDPSIASYATREEAEGHITAHGPGVRAHLEVVEWPDEAGELAALRELEAALDGLNAGDEHPSAVNENYFAEFVRDELDDIYGDAIDGLDVFLKWDEIKADRAQGLSTTDYRGHRFYLVP